MTDQATLSRASKLDPSNPYAGGTVYVFADGTAKLKAKEFTYSGGPGDRYHTVKAGETLDMLAHRYYQAEVPDAERWHWLIRRANGIRRSVDLSALVGEEIIIPNVGNFKLRYNR